MRKNAKKTLSGMLSVLLLVLTIMPAYAAQPQDEISPMYAVPINVSVEADISGTNELGMMAYYSVYDPTVTRVEMTTYVEKRSLLVIWNRVDIGESNNEWTDIGGYGFFDVTHTAQLPSSGTYRVTTVFEVYGGSVLLDTIEERVTVDC